MGRLSDAALLADDLFGQPLARNSDPETSHKAAARVAGVAGTDRREVLRIHASRPDGLTDFELAATMKRQQTSVGKRRGELCAAGFIERTLFTRPAPSGSPAIVWRITGQGLTFAKVLR